MFAFVSQDLAMYINEVKRDNETLKKISEFQSSIENLVSSLNLYICFSTRGDRLNKFMFKGLENVCFFQSCCK